MKTINEKDLELLCRYDENSWDEWMLEESENWEYVRWDSLIQLLK